MGRIFSTCALAALGAIALTLTAPLAAQVTSIDPNSAIDADLDQPPLPAPPPAATTATPETPGTWTTEGLETPTTATPDATTSSAPTPATTSGGQTYHEDDLIGAAEGVFGRGAEGLARLIQNILREQGEPNGYIVGREAGGAFVFGLRYGSGTLHHRIEGEQPVYWTGPSVGFDAGANAGNTFVLVYNLHDTEDLYHRIPAGEGAAYVVGGLNASYLRRGDIVLIPIRVGVGARLGVNVGYMKFSHRQRWLPF
ncbi:MAG: DUF1134 domain-containing protein [Sphingopyxis sp.]